MDNLNLRDDGRRGFSLPIAWKKKNGNDID